jgi:flagellar basal-body rod protein FlgC
MNLFGVLDISSGALKAERLRAEVVAANLANAETTRTPEGGPYVRQQVIFSAARSTHFGDLMQGLADTRVPAVEVTGPVSDPTPAVLRYEPGHPDANAAGMVAYPAINPAQEMVDLMGAARAYQLNTAAVQATKNMISESLQILH